MTTYGVGGALLSRQEPLGWGCGRTLEKVGSHSQAFLDLWWGMGLGLDFGMIYGVGIRFSKMLFLFFLGIAWSKDASVAANVELLGSSIQWNVSFTREAHDWEVGVFAYFLQVLHSVTVRRGSENKLLWVFSRLSRSSILCVLKGVAFLGRACSGPRLL